MVSVLVTHDAHVAVTRGGTVLVVLELERLVNTRYFHAVLDPAVAGDSLAQGRLWRQALEVVTAAAIEADPTLAVTAHSADGGAGGLLFDAGVHVNAATPFYSRNLAARTLVELVFPARRWCHVDHHAAHALLGAVDSPFARPLVVSFDGGGSDGVFRAFEAEPPGEAVDFELRLRPLLDAPMNMGSAYSGIGSVLPEVNRCARPEARAGPPGSCQVNDLGFAGRMMGFAALGKGE